MLIKDVRKNLFSKLKKLIEKEVVIDEKKILLNQDEYEGNIYILLSGEYKLTHIVPDKNAREFTIGYYTNEGILLPSLIGCDSFLSLFRVETMERCIFGVIPIKNLCLDEKLQSDILMYHHIICQKIYLQMRDLLFNRKQEGLMSILIRLANTYGIKEKNGEIKITIKLSNKDLAEYIGTTPETISRILSKFKKDNLVKQENKYIILKNIQYMKKVMNCKFCNERLCEI